MIFFFTSRVYLALVEEAENRGLVVQQGGAKALLPLATDGTEEGQTRAAQALAKIGITMNPEIAFPGQRVRNHLFLKLAIAFDHHVTTSQKQFTCLGLVMNILGLGSVGNVCYSKLKPSYKMGLRIPAI